jgi:phenylalanyl-tRNA synthetase beta chain
MKFTLSWLKEHLETEASLDEILEKLTSLGLVVDRVENKAEALASFTICEIIEAGRHPNADRLQVCRVNTGTEVLQVVCGAPNARKGLKTILAKPGVVIPSSQQVLKVGKVRDVESYGMLCSASELLLEEESEGIFEADPSAPVGESFVKWAGLDDVLIEVDITPNRADCLGVYGIARDLSATGIGKLKPLKAPVIKGNFPCPLSLTVDLEASPYFTGRLIRGVKNGPSPAWLQNRLKSIGLRPISALVDITNYLTHDRARPLHVFDGDKIKGGLTVRFSKPGESLVALDEKTYKFSEDTAVIADESGVISIGGIMGGLSTGCDEGTQTVFLECAFFDPIRTTLTGRNLGILSDARFRFERGVDPFSTLPGLEAATQMILEICGGEASEVVSQGTPPDLRKPVSFHFSHVESLGGLAVAPIRAKEILTSLGFEVTGQGESCTVLPPSWRFDVEREQDLVEEVLRVEGYDKIPATPFATHTQIKPLTPLQERRFVVRDRLAARGLMETVTWSFMAEEDTTLFGGVPESLSLLNPISQDLKAMRPSILPNLLKAACSNQNRGMDSIDFFEIGPQYQNATPEGQHMMVSGLRAGFFNSMSWLEKRRPVDLYDAKADALAVIELDAQWDRMAPSWYHPGRSATLKLGAMVLGYFGELHPLVLKAFDVKGPVVGFEVFLDRLPLPKKKTTAKQKLALSQYQTVDRDFAFVVDQSVPADSLLKAAQKVDPGLIENVTIFDVFEMGEGKKSLGIRVRLQPKEHTLTEEEIQAVVQKIIAAVTQSTGGVLR